MLLIALTENNWLFAGIAELMPEVLCLRMEFDSCHLPPEVRAADRFMVVVDSQIFFRGEWAAFNALRALRNDASVVWLTRKNSGRVFPLESQGDRLLSHNLDIVSLRVVLRNLLWGQSTGTAGGVDYVSTTELTLTERRLLPGFVSGLSVQVFSRITGIPVKTLHAHRQSILVKTGFRKQAFLQFVYERNHGLPGIPVPEGICPV
ncbi:transcriptional regulator [Enterobacter cancerogenus]|uniref:Transcriptional regulator n=1 Tax=Enterobacter cancerogenus TaxID=69218 RepID=A0AB38NXM7_9ENTR|nr:transcriptional regulator [Enterobacter cancerogenus]TKK12449.1 transcriptional regulator [Enterobacter cancerogenus]